MDIDKGFKILTFVEQQGLLHTCHTQVTIEHSPWKEKLQWNVILRLHSINCDDAPSCFLHHTERFNSKTLKNSKYIF
jgi:hypothetical protein